MPISAQHIEFCYKIKYSPENDKLEHFMSSLAIK